MSKFRIGDPVKIKSFSMYAQSVNDDDLFINAALSCAPAHDEHENVYAVARKDGYVLRQLFTCDQLEAIPEPMIPMHEIERLSEELESYYTQTGFSMDYWGGYHAQRKKINFKLKEILNKYKDSE